MDKYAFGNRLCTLRTEKGYTQEKLGRMLGVSNKAISKWENGTTQPRLQMLDRIAACFDMSVEELLEYDEKSGESESVAAGKQVSGIPDAIMHSPRFSASILMGIGWLKVDAPKFLSEIKGKYGLTNREIANIFETSEKTIGLWENGLKQPNAVQRFRIAAFYYGNGGEKDLVTELTDSNGLYKTTRIAMIAGGVFLALMFYLVYYPLYVIGDRVYYFEHAGVAAPFSLKGILIFVIPNAVMLCAYFLYIKYIRQHRPELERTNTACQTVLIGVFIYLIADWLIFLTPSYMLGAFAVFAVLAAGLHFLKNSKLSEALSVIFLLALTAPIVIRGSELADEEIMMVNPGDELILGSLMMFSLLLLMEVMFFQINRHYNSIKGYFPPTKKENQKFNKRDYLWYAVAVIISSVYYLLLELFRRELYLLFSELPELP